MYSFIVTMAFAADIQCFRQPGGDIVVKELAILPLDHESDPVVSLFKAPFPWSRLTEKYKIENNWFKRMVHGLSWDSGDLEYIQLGSRIRDSLTGARTVYVIGSRNKKFMERFKFSTIDIMDLGYPQFDKSKVVQFCTNHDFECNVTCAAQNVQMIKKFFNAQKQWEDVSMEWEYA